MLTLLSFFSINVFSQTRFVTLNLNKKPISEAMTIIENQTGYLFYYSPNEVDTKRLVSIAAINLDINNVLKTLFKNSDLTFSFLHRHIILKKEYNYIKSNVKVELDSTCCTSFVIGNVRNEVGEILEGVSVGIKNTNLFTLTDKKGSFSIKIPNKQCTVVFSSIGYIKKELAVCDSMKLKVVLQPEQMILDDIVVVGYSSQNRKDLTGAISKVNLQDLSKASVRSFDEALAGRVPGMQVTSQDGQPGSPINVVIRGSNSLTQDNSPLYVIDGFPIEGYNNNLLSPNDIESIDVLKDASATAIYGARAANGVIVILTKKGKEGPPIINYDCYYGLQQNLKKIPLLSPYEYVKLQIERDSIGASNVFIDNNTSIDDYKRFEGIDWQNELFRIAPMSNNSISVSGGNKQTKYTFSGSINFQDGIIIASGYKRYQGRASIDQVITKKAIAGINFSYSNVLQYGTSPGSTAANSTYNLLFQTWGYRPVEGKDGASLLNVTFDPLINPLDNAIINPVSSAKNELRNNFTNNLVANIYFEYTLLRKIKFKATCGINNSLNRKDVFNNSQTSSGNPYSYTGYGVNGSITYIESNNWLNENTMTYNNNFNKHKLTIVLGATEQGSTSKYFGTASIKIPNESLGLSGIGEGIPLSVQSVNSLWTMASLIGRINYDFNNRYLLSATYRADGSSRFSKENKWSFFPSISLAWKFGHENFIKKINTITDGKFRLSYGVTGNNRVGDFSYLSAMSSPIEAIYAFNGNTSSNIGTYRSTIGNPNLKWETTYQVNVGLDITVFNRLSLSIDLYNKTTKDLLLNAQLPTSTGYANAFKNIGKVANKGIEISLTYSNRINKNLRWTSDFNIAFNSSKTLNLTEGQQMLTSSVAWDQYFSPLPAYVAKLGQPISSIYGLKFDGLYKYSDFNILPNNKYILKDNIPTNGSPRASIQPGDLKYMDLNGDGVADSKDYTTIGSALPAFIGGFVNNFFYKNFDLNIFLQWSFGNDVINANRYLFEASYRPYLNQFATYANRWTALNQNTAIPRVGGSLPYQYSSRVVEDASFMRVKTISIGYTPAIEFLKRLSIKSLRFYISCQNLITLTSYSGLDPEVSVRNTALTQGFDFSPYPRARSITLGLSTTF